MHCPNCKVDNPQGMQFCGACGASLSPRCPQCGFENPSPFNFCGMCGAGLKGQKSVSDSEPAVRQWPEAETRLYALLPAIMGLLQRERRVTLRRLQFIFGIDEALLQDVRQELLLQQVTSDEAGQVLVWVGETQPVSRPASVLPDLPTASQAVIVPPSSSLESTPPASIPDTLEQEAVPSPAPVRSQPEAERRQITVMFCDLADSTRLSGQLDPEDLRQVIQAYQQTAVAIVQQFDGYVAQYLGDGLLIYFGWPRAHEDDTQRALHTGLGIVDAITTTLNPRLEHEKGVRLTVRIGIHTGPVVVGEMGGGGRHEHLATGETVNIAARLEGLAAPNTVLISPTTARLVEGMFTLEGCWDPHAQRGGGAHAGLPRVWTS